jgi:putative acetyltransferase
VEEVQIISYSPKYAKVFKSLNEAWITKYFELEEEDIKTLGDPEKIIRDGGFILVAILRTKGEAVGVCALRKSGDKTYEFSKMAVSEEMQGLGIGKKLGEAAIEKAKGVGAKRIFLEGNTALKASIHLYKKLGFNEIKGQKSHYKRVNIVMERHIE